MTAPTPAPRVSLDELLDIVRAFALTAYPGRKPLRFRLEMEDGEALAILLPQVQATGPCTHAPDFRSIVWYGKTYRFTPTQAAIVKVLWLAWEGGTPEVGQQSLLEDAGSESGRLLDLFRDHPAIVDGIITRPRRGVWCLMEPE